jgi:tyrosyl-DNA phosphodiesterase 2
MLSCLHTQAFSWWHQTPLPAVGSSSETPSFQKWQQHLYGQWTPYRNRNAREGTQHRWAGILHILTWNIDAASLSPASRVTGLIRTIKDVSPLPEVIFLQEVSKIALSTLLADPWIQKEWLSSEADTSNYGKQAFSTVTLISKSGLAKYPISLGPIWRVPLPSRFDRDALCCDILLNDSNFEPTVRVRLINVHLDSLPNSPSYRPQQVSIVASYLHAAGRGLIAGDFNSVLPEDYGLISENLLLDSWLALHPWQPGCTWGGKGDKSFPPARLDKVAMLNLFPSRLDLLRATQKTVRQEGEPDASKVNGAEHFERPFSSHFGLACTFIWMENVPRKAEE